MIKRSGRHWMTAALVVVLVLDVVLIYLALRPPEPPGDAAVAVRPAPSAEPSPTPPPEPVVGVPATRLLDALSADEAWRATAGVCPGGGALVERTQDGGATWQPADAELAAYVRLKATTAREAFVVGQSAEGCDPAFADTRTGGEQWRDVARSLDVAWYVDPLDRRRIHSSAGYFAGPCGGPVVDLAPVTSTAAAVLCPDGTLHETADGAAGWTQRVAVPGAVALSDHRDGYALAVLGSPDCDGVAVATVAGDDVTAVGCAAGASATPDRVAVSATGDVVWLWVGDQVLRSLDAGASWS